jgi:MFS family permease
MKFFNNIRTFESLSIRDYRLLWFGQAGTSMGMWMDQTARSWLIYSLTGSPLQLGLSAAVRGLPMLFFGVIAGVVADRYGRKKQLIIAQVVNAIVNAFLATLILTGHIQPWHIYVTGFLNGTVQAFQQPARQVLIHDLVGKKHLLNAISLNSAVSNLSRSLGPAFCAVLIQYFDVAVSYYFQAAMYALATVWTIQIHEPPLHTAVAAATQTAPQSQSIFGSAKEGFAYIAANPLILALIILGLAPILLGMPYNSLMPIFAIDILHGNAITQGLLLSAAGVGAIFGALVIASLRDKGGNGKLLIIGAAGFGLSLVLFSRSPVVGMAMCFTFLAGLLNSAYTAQNQTIIQLLVPAQMRGRVLGVYLLDRGLMPLGSLLAGVMATHIGAPWAVTLMGSSCVILAVAVAIWMKDLWRLNALRTAEKAL